MVYSTQIQSKVYTNVGEPGPKMNTDHPIHPALVHFPIAFNILAWGLDLVYYVTTVHKPEFLVSRFQPHLLDMCRASFYLLALGCITTVPAIISGNKQLFGMIGANGGMYAKDANGKRLNYMLPKIKATVQHALLNDVIMAANCYTWWQRRKIENVGLIPSDLNIAFSAALLPLLMMSSAWGAHLTYNHGIGLHLGRKKVD